MSPELWAELWISVKSMRSKFVLPVLKKETKKTPTLICGWKNFLMQFHVQLYFYKKLKWKLVKDMQICLHTKMQKLQIK